MLVSNEGNEYFQESKFWKAYKSDPESCDVTMRTAAGLVYLLACLLEPYIPSVSHEILKQLSLEHVAPLSLSDPAINNVKNLWEILPSGHKIGRSEPLFKELDGHENVDEDEEEEAN